MVDPIDLMLLQRFQDLGIERFGRSEVVTEGLFDDDPAPLAVTLSRKARGSKRGHRRTKETVGDREIEQIDCLLCPPSCPIPSDARRAGDRSPDC